MLEFDRELIMKKLIWSVILCTLRFLKGHMTKISNMFHCHIVSDWLAVHVLSKNWVNGMQSGDDPLGDHIYPTGCPMGRRYFCPRLFEKGFHSREDLKFFVDKEILVRWPLIFNLEWVVSRSRRWAANQLRMVGFSIFLFYLINLL